MRIAIRLALRLYPRWWKRRYGREIDALLEDAGAGWPAAFDLARGALVVRARDIEGRMSRLFSKGGTVAFRQRLGIGLALTIGMMAGYAARPYIQTRTVHFVPSDTNTFRLESTGANLIRMSFKGSVIEARRIDVFDSGFAVIGGRGEFGAVPSQ